jgi:hypothetical protein
VASFYGVAIDLSRLRNRIVSAPFFLFSLPAQERLHLSLSRSLPLSRTRPLGLMSPLSLSLSLYHTHTTKLLVCLEPLTAGKGLRQKGDLLGPPVVPDPESIAAQAAYTSIPRLYCPVCVLSV